MSAHKFQVHLGGLIDLLSHHLYSGPEVYVRELLQNAVDAIAARDDAFDPRIDIRLDHGPDGPRLHVRDNGIGLTEDEVHRFLATIGESSKRGVDAVRKEFLGQFGIGLLSGFLVSDHIELYTRSAKTEDAPVIHWRGHKDGTYEVGHDPDRTAADFAAGTEVILTARPDAHALLDVDTVVGLARHYGSLLEPPIVVHDGMAAHPINDEGAPWRQPYASPGQRREALLAYGQRVFNQRFFDAVPLVSSAGHVDGVAFVLAHSPSLAQHRADRAYLKGMLLSDRVDNLMPEWAFFVRGVLDVRGLRPTASRESFADDDALDLARDELGDCLRRYLTHLEQHDPERLTRLIAVHHLALKALAADDDESLRLFIDYLPFETSLGRMLFRDIRVKTPHIAYTPNLDAFRQMAAVAAAQGSCIVNAAYAYERRLIERLPAVLDGITVQEVDAASLLESFGELDLDERDLFADFLAEARHVLATRQCEPALKRFAPTNLPTLFADNPDAAFVREVERQQDEGDDLWSAVLDGVAAERARAMPKAQLVFNLNNPLVERLLTVDDPALRQLSIQTLYVQALLLGHFPLRPDDLRLLADGMIGLIEFGLDAHARWVQ